jgi:hypothetical protein
MDAHVFRLVGGEIAARLSGARLEKIHAPAPEMTLFTFFAAPAGQRLLLLSGAQRPFLFFSSRPPANPERPSALVMRLRKAAAGRRLGQGITDFSRRALAFPLLEEGNIVRYLFLDLRRGPAILPRLPGDFGREPFWPDGAVLERCRRPEEDGEGILRTVYAVLTPLLRETLIELDLPEARALMTDLAAGSRGLYVYGDAARRPVFLSAWPLPERVAARRGLSFLCEAGEERFSSSETVLAWAEHVGENLLSVHMAAPAAREEAREKARRAKRLRRLRDRLDQEERRLNSLLALREDARLLQAHLWRFAPEERRPEVFLSGEEGLPPRRIALDPLLSVRENMRRMFRHSARGARGLAILRERRRALSEAGEGAAETGGMPSSPDVSFPPSRARGGKDPSPARPDNARAAISGRSGRGLKDIAGFSSSDGYVLLRGKNARGNQLLLSLGRPQDLWLHARGGPSAHLLIRRAHAGDTVPEQTLREAAVLVGLKSWQRSEGKADIMIALCRHVHAVKGATPGTARVDRELPGITVSLPRTEED